VDRTGFRNWILSQVDQVSAYSLTAHGQTGYLTAELSALKQDMRSLYASNFTYLSKNYTAFDLREINLALRFAYGEKRIPLFDFYFPISTKYPVAYLRTGVGTINAGEYSARFIRSLAAITYSKRINRWGKDAFQLEAGLIHVLDNKPISRSFLLAAKGFRSEGLNFYAWGGFITMRPSDYSITKYASLMFKHDFEKNLWKTKYSRPYLSVAHNLMYGNMQAASRIANAGVKAPLSGYHESGLVVNQLIQKNFLAVTYLYLNFGAFYHWTPSFNWKNNGVFVVGISTGF
jgi:hypothetical protein